MSPISAIGVRSGRVLAAAAVAVALAAGLAARPAAAAVPDACGLVTTFQIAGAFGLTNAVEHRTLAGPEGNPAGVLHVRCRVFAWSGGKPANERRKRRALLAGRLAWLNVDNWLAERSPYAPSWRAHFDAELKALRAASVRLYLKRLGGRAFAPPRYGAEEAIAYRAVTRRAVKLRALWWKRSDKSMIEINLEEARGKPALRSLKRLGATMVERFNDECVYPCEAPATG